MPVYEEKLISPLAIRFTQEHVSSTFSDGRILEDVVPQVSAATGAGPFEIVLQAPFPAIEVARWRACKLSQNRLQRDNPVFGLTAEQGTDHWFSMDNRRLYVLQRAATALWPRRVGVAVDILYAVPDELYQKFDSSTCGLLASVGDSGHCTTGTTWNWLAWVTPAHGPADMRQEKSALKQVRHDDMVDELTFLADVPCGSPVSRALEAEQNQQVSPALSLTTFTCQTDSHASENDGVGQQMHSHTAEPQQRSSRAMQPLEGIWRGKQHETYTVVFQTSGKKQVLGTVVRQHKAVSKSFSITYDRDSGHVFWGSNNKYALALSEVVDNPRSAKWYLMQDLKFSTTEAKPAFEWIKTDPSDEASSRASLAPAAAMEKTESEFKKSGRRPVHRGRHWKPTESGC